MAKLPPADQPITPEWIRAVCEDERVDVEVAVQIIEHELENARTVHLQLPGTPETYCGTWVVVDPPHAPRTTNRLGEINCISCKQEWLRAQLQLPTDPNRW